MLEGTIKLPAVGTVKKTYVVAGVGITLAAALWYVHERRVNALATPATATGTDSAGNTGVIDPATGFVTGSPEDLSALSGSDLSYQPVAGGGGTGGDSSGSVGDQVTNGPPFTTNAAWEQYALQQLQANAGPDYDASAVVADLGAYLAGGKVTPDQKTVIESALGLAGPVPVTGANGYPPSINMVGNPSGPGSTPPAPVTNVKAATISTTSVVLTWSAATGATGYAWTVGGKSGTTTATTVTVTGLTAGTSYTATVDSTGPGGASSPASVTFKTLPVAVTPPKPTPPKTPTPTYAAVKVVKFTTKNPPWNSTISGIAGHYHTTASAVWNDAKNAALRSKRGSEDKIQPGDTVYVRTS